MTANCETTEANKQKLQKGEERVKGREEREEKRRGEGEVKEIAARKACAYFNCLFLDNTNTALKDDHILPSDIQ